MSASLRPSHGKSGCVDRYHQRLATTSDENETKVNCRSSWTADERRLPSVLDLFGIPNLGSRAWDSLQFRMSCLLHDVVFLCGDGGQRGEPSEHSLG
jgi:hypothetical protein